MFRRSRQAGAHLVTVRGEHGARAGLVTRGDLLEEIVGGIEGQYLMEGL